MLLTAVDGDYVDDAETATNLRAILHRASASSASAPSQVPRGSPSGKVSI